MDKKNTNDSQAEEPKNHDWIILLALVFLAAVIGGFIWYFGFYANQGEIIINESLKEPLKNISPTTISKS
ncbi:hypothetical protein KJ885_04350 [Patescibacteria group bacterium]|nr:hypothetical protein [Patescibacteria group bacterium]